MIVTKPYTGVLSSLPMELSEFGLFVMNSGTYSVDRWNPQIDLKVAGERDIFPTSVVGAQPTDSISAPGPVRVFDNQFAPYVSSNISGEPPSVYPTVQIIIITDGGLAGFARTLPVSVSGRRLTLLNGT